MTALEKINGHVLRREREAGNIIRGKEDTKIEGSICRKVRKCIKNKYEMTKIF